MPSRRDVVRAAGLAAAWPPLAFGQSSKAKAAAAKAKPPPTILVNDVHAQLSSARVFAVVQPTDLEGVKQAFELAHTEEKSVCIAGGRHSMGGQPFAEDGVLIDTRKLARVIGLDVERGLIEVEPGIQWPQLARHLAEAQAGRERPWTFAQKQAGADRMTLGGSLSANFHGRGLGTSPFIADLDSFRLLNTESVLAQCSRTENPELFRLAVGGYGLFGFVTTLTLRLAPRQLLERAAEVRSAAGLAGVFEEQARAGYVMGEFLLAVDDKSPDFLARGVLVCHRPAAAGAPPPDKRRGLAERDWLEILHLAHTAKGEAFSRLVAHYQATHGQLYWSDEVQMAAYPEGYHREIDRRRNAERRSTESICALLCERERLDALLADLREMARREKIEIVHALVRAVEPDRESFLAWARKPYACIDLHVHVEHGTSGTIRAGDQFRRLLDLGVKHGGGFHPAYNRYALRRQVDAALPRMQDFLRLKRKYDPQEVLQSDWYRHYRRMYFGN
jgi:FAD/FMN-containing dehydrogenase